MPKLNIETRWIPDHQTVYIDGIPRKWVKHILQIRATLTPAPPTAPALSFSGTSKTMQWRISGAPAWDTIEGPRAFDNEALTIPADGAWHIIGTAPNEESLTAYARDYAPEATNLENYIEAKGYSQADVDIATAFSGTGSCTVGTALYSATFATSLTSTVTVVVRVLTIEGQVIAEVPTA